MPGSPPISTFEPSNTGSLGSSKFPPHVGCPVVGAQVVIMPRVGVSSLFDLDALLSFDRSSVTPLHTNIMSVGVLAEVVIPPRGMFRLGRFNDLDAPPSLNGSSGTPSKVLREAGRTTRGNESQNCGKQANLRDQHVVCSCAGCKCSDIHSFKGANEEMLFPLFCL